MVADPRRASVIARAATHQRGRGGRTAARREPPSRASPRAACSAGTRARPPSASREGLLDRGRVVAEHARELAQHGVQHDHRRQLAAGQHVAADRDLLGHEVLEDALVEALVAAAQQRERRRSAASSEASASSSSRPAGVSAITRRGDAQLDRIDAVAIAQRRLHHVHAQHHPRAAAERRVVDLPPLQRRGRRGSRPPRPRGPSASAFSTWRWVRNHSNHCGNSVKTSAFTEEAQVDVDPARLDVDRADAVAHQRHEQLRAVRRGRPRAPRRSAARSCAARSRPTTSPSTTAQPSRSRAQNSPSSSIVVRRAARSARCRAAPSASSRDDEPSSRRIGFSAVPARRTIRRARRARRRRRPPPGSSGAGSTT